MKTVEEVDSQVNKLSNSGNAATRGVLFANMYIQINQFEKAVPWLLQYLKVRDQDPEAWQLLGTCYLNESYPTKALEAFRRSLEIRPKQPAIALRVAELLIRRAETKNLNSAQIWLAKAESLNKGSSNLFSLKMEYMKCKGAKPNEIVNFILNQIRQNPRQITLYTTLIQQMQEGGLDAAEKVNQLETDHAIKSMLCKSTIWLEIVISNRLQSPNILTKKQIFLAHLKLQNHCLTSQDLMTLDTMLEQVTDVSLKAEGGAQLLYLTANLPEVDEKYRNILLLQSLANNSPANLDKSFTALINQRKLVCYLFLNKLDFTKLNEDYSLILSSENMRLDFARKILCGSQYLLKLLIPCPFSSLPLLQNLEQLVASCGYNLDIVLWIFGCFEVGSKRCECVRKYVTATFHDTGHIPGFDGDQKNLTQSDLEAFIIGVMQSVPKTASLPQFIQTQNPQKQFFNAICEIRSANVSKVDLVMYRNIIRNSKNVIRLKGSEPAPEILAAIASFFATMNDPILAVFYFEAVESKLKTISTGGGVMRPETITLFGEPTDSLTAADAKNLLDQFAESRGQKMEFEGNYQEATRLYQLANRPSSLYKAAKLIIRKTENEECNRDEIMEEYTNANELCSQAASMSPNSQLAAEISDFQVRITELTSIAIDEEAIDATVDKTRESSNESSYMTAGDNTILSPTSRRLFPSPTKQIKTIASSIDAIKSENEFLRERTRLLEEQMKAQVNAHDVYTKTMESQVKTFNDTLGKMTSMLQNMMNPTAMAFPPNTQYMHAMQMNHQMHHLHQQALAQHVAVSQMNNMPMSSVPATGRFPGHAMNQGQPRAMQQIPLSHQLQINAQANMSNTMRSNADKTVDQFLMEIAPRQSAPQLPTPQQAPAVPNVQTSSSLQPTITNLPTPVETTPKPIKSVITETKNADKVSTAETNGFTFSGERSAPPRFSFNPDAKTLNNAEAASQETGTKPTNKLFSFGNQLTSTPSRPATKTFVFKSPEEVDQENAKLDEEERRDNDVDPDAGPHFEPVIPLPELVAIKTGEEDEIVSFCSRGKLYRFSEGEWKERGLGDVKILKNNCGKSRVLMRREQVLKVCANHFIQSHMTLVPLNGKDTVWMWTAMDCSDETEAPVNEKLAIRFKHAETAKEFEKVFNKAKLDSEKKSDESVVPKVTEAEKSEEKTENSKPSGKFSFGFDFEMESTETVVPEPVTVIKETESVVPATVTMPSTSVSFNFAKPASEKKTNEPFSFNFANKPTPPSGGAFSFKPAEPNKETTAEDKNEVAEEDSTDPHFEPIVSLEEVEVRTGEEDDDILFAARAKLYRFSDNQWKERGLGELKILRSKKTNKSRILMRRENIHKLCANHIIEPTIKLCTLEGKNNTRVWFAMDGTMEEENASVQQFCVRFKSSDIAEDFEANIMAEKDNKPVESIASISKKSSETTPAITNVTINQLNPDIKETKPSVFSKNVAPPQEEVKESKNLFGGIAASLKETTSNNNTGAFSFKPVADAKPTATIEASPKSDDPSGKGFSFSFGGKSTFSALANKNESTFQFDGGFNFANKGKPLFTPSVPQKDENEELKDEEECVDAHFEPVIPLPSLVQVKTGEEGLEVLFSSRAKLYRWNEDQWKERGLGECKILKDPKTGKGRVLLRREQVLKLACNHYIDTATELTPTNGSATSWTWGAMDNSDGESTFEKFAIKFKNAELATEFKTAFYSLKKSKDSLSDKKVAEAATPKSGATGFSFGIPAASSDTNGPSSSAFGGFGKTTPPEVETPGEMVQRLEREQINKEIAAAAGKFTFGVATAKDSDPSSMNNTGFGTSATVTGEGKTFSFGVTKSTADVQDFKNSTGFGTIARQDADHDDSDLYGENSEGDSEDYPYSDGEINDDESVYEDGDEDDEDEEEDVLFVKVSEVLPNVDLIQKARDLCLPDHFYNYLLLSDNSEDSETFPWERENIDQSDSPDEKFEEVTKEEVSESMPKPVFGQKTAESFNFGARNNGFGGFATKSNCDGFQFSLKTGDAFKNSGKPLFGTSSGGNGDQEIIDECTTQFKPVLDELPPEIEITTGLEDDDEVFSRRAKLYRFARECTPQEWKERGVGDIKITQSKATKRFRIVMRRDQVFKVCANHYITAEMALSRNANSDKAWVWTAMDYGDPNEPNGVVEQFCVRFKTAEIANEFKTVFEDSQNKLLDAPDFSPGREDKFISGEGLPTDGKPVQLTPLVQQHQEGLNRDDAEAVKQNLFGSKSGSESNDEQNKQESGSSP